MRFAYLFSLLIFAQTIFAQLNLELLGRLEYPSTTLAGCWHYRAADGTPYALVGTSKGMSIVDLTDPSSPTEVQAVLGKPSNWREVKTHGDFAYVTTEAIESGVQIMDLSGLPDTVLVKDWFGDSLHPNLISHVHALAIADGYMYLFGGSTGTNGATICDLTDPWNPEIVGQYTDFYVHDGYVRNDTLWSAEIYQGHFSVVDVSDKAAPFRLTSEPTPGAFPHNTWLSDDSQICFTADERPNTPLGAFDVSDLQNITLLDRYFPSQKPDKEVHNVRVHGRYLINACYGGQLTVVDAQKPDNLVEVAWALLGDALVWDADPYLSDTLIFATDKLSGLFIYKPNYGPAALLEGTVYDDLTQLPLDNAKIEIVGLGFVDSTNVSGGFKTGTGQPGTYTVKVSKQGYLSDFIDNVALTSDVITEVTSYLTPMPISTSEIGAEDVAVWPSVFSDYIFVNLNGGRSSAKNTEIRLYDGQGILVKKQLASNVQTKLEGLGGLEAGSYFVQIRTEMGVFSTKKVVKR